MSPSWRLVILGVLVAAATACSSPTPPPPAPAPAPAEQGDAHSGHPSAARTERTTLLGNLGSFGRKIQTSNAEAQQFFDEGLTLLYGFNHEEAFRSFARVAALDDRAPMPHWGMALALGTNINDPAPADRIAKAYTHLAAAQQRAANGSPVEQALIAALAKRYVEKPEGDQLPREQAYSDAMGEIAKRFPDDPDVATLYAESLMNLRPWRLYDKDGKPEPGTETIVTTLERVMVAHPDHPGANHYYIHAVEASKNPDRALAQADRLEKLVPGAGHLVHMPAHIYIRTGQYARSARSNADAARVDERYFKKAGQEGMYPLMYYGHNLQFESAAAMFAGRYAQARDAAKQTVDLLDPVGDASPMLEPYALQEAWVALRFGRWDDALKVKTPPASRTVQTALAHYVRGAALAELGKLAEAEEARQAFQAAVAAVPEDLMISPTNRGRAVLEVAAADLDGRIAVARKDIPKAVAAFTRAVESEDRLLYNEPPDWLLTERERLGAVLLAAGRAATAESTFRKDLERNVGNPRSLFGLWKALEAQKKPEATGAKAAFEAAWKDADVTLDATLHGTPR
jgi:tetratricopeptide (TPR) repeat protein